MIDTRTPIVDIESQAEAIDPIVKESGGVRLSVFLPIYNQGSEIRQNAIRLKDLIEEARRGLKLAGMQSSEMDRFLAPFNQLLEHPEQLRHESPAVALLLDADSLRRIHLNYDTEAMCCVSDRFAVKPLLPILQSNPVVTVLSLNQGEVRVFRGVGSELQAIEVDGMPKDIGDLTEYDDPEKTLQNHTATRTSKTNTTGSTPVSGFHGHGMPDTYKEDLKKRFFQQVAQAIESFLVDKKDALIVFGVAANIGHFKQVNASSQRIYIYADRDTSHWDLARISSESIELLQPELEQATASKLDHIEEAVGQGKEIAGIAECAVAAAMGRIESAVVAADEQVYGKCDLDRLRVDFYEEGKTLCEQDLLDFIASETYRHGGSVIALPQDRIPSGRRAVAVGRF